MDLEGFLLPLASAVGAGLAAGAAALGAGWLAARRAGDGTPGSFLRHLGPPALLLGPILFLRLSLPALGLGDEATGLLRHGLVLASIGAIGFLVIAAAAFLDDFVRERFPVDVEDNLAARRIHTRFVVLRRLVLAVTLLLCGAAALMTFPGLRALGTGLLASAGIIGIVIGIAARPSVEAFIAGIQLAWTQPVRLDDVVVIEGEWGRIEGIEATYVVVRLWDLRRLIVPLSHLLSQPYQNWTRKSSDLLGAVLVDVDYRTPVETVRRRVGEILAESPAFGGGFWNLQVVEAGPQTMRLRVLIEAPNADEAWALRCEVREKLIAYLQSEHPECLPRLRAELPGGAPRDGAGGAC